MKKNYYLFLIYQKYWQVKIKIYFKNKWQVYTKRLYSTYNINDIHYNLSHLVKFSSKTVILRYCITNIYKKLIDCKIKY